MSVGTGDAAQRPLGWTTETTIPNDSRRLPPTSRPTRASPASHAPIPIGSPHTVQDMSQHDGHESESDSDSDNEDSEEDPLRNGATQAPLRDTVNAVTSTHRSVPANNNKRGFDGPTPSDTRSKKRSRLDDKDLTCARLRAQILPFSRGGYSITHHDPIACGVLSETEAQRLFALWVVMQDPCSQPDSSPSVIYTCRCLNRIAIPCLGECGRAFVD